MGKESLHKFLFCLTFDPDLNIPYHGFFPVSPTPWYIKELQIEPACLCFYLHCLCDLDGVTGVLQCKLLGKLHHF